MFPIFISDIRDKIKNQCGQIVDFVHGRGRGGRKGQ